MSAPGAIKFSLPKAGLVYSERGNLAEVMCKPKLLPIKSAELQRLEAMEKDAAQAAQAAQQQRAQTAANAAR